MMRYFSTNAGRGVAGVFLAALLFAWPPACAYIIATFLLAWAGDQLNRAFREVEHAEAIQSGKSANAVSGGAAGAGSQLERANGGGVLVNRGGVSDQGIQRVEAG